MRHNPFAGENSNPTLNFELAADTTLGSWAAAINLGYRKRSPGDAIANQPFLPLKDQWTYSLAASYLTESYNLKWIAKSWCHGHSSKRLRCES